MTQKRTISVVASAAGVNVETVRYYQRIGLLEEPAKPLSGFRAYPPSAIDRIRFIQRAKALGFSLKEIRLLLDLDDGCCQQTRSMAEQKRAMVQQKIADLSRLAAVLDRHIAACRDNRDDGCPLIRALGEKDFSANER